MEERNVYQYNIRLHLENPVFEEYDLKIIFNAAFIEFDSESFSNYKQCVDDCHAVIETFKKQIEQNTKEELVLGWEANPKRSKDAQFITPEEKWSLEEIIHVFLYKKTDEITIKTAPILSSTIIVNAFDMELAEVLS
jgi:hypothetical protein